MIYVKFGVDETSANHILLFRKAVEKFARDRPQEFHKTVGFRLTRVESDLRFTEYVIVLLCRVSWQKTNEVLESKAKVSRFCLAVQKKLGIRYSSPPMPVNLSVDKGAGGTPAPSRREAVASRRDSDLAFSLKTDDGDASKSRRGSAASMVDGINALSQLFEPKKTR
jgi:hypothetical protein